MAEVSEIEAGGEVRTIKDTTARQGVAELATKIIDTYSADEIKTNKVWINSKPIYRKVFQSTAFNVGGETTIATGLTFINEVVSMNGTLYRENGTISPIPRTHINSMEFNANVYISANRDLRIELGGSLTSPTKAYIILEYTKITD